MNRVFQWVGKAKTPDSRARSGSILFRIWRDDRGVTLVEYGIALVLAIVVGTTLLVSIGAGVSTNMTDAGSTLADWTP